MFMPISHPWLAPRSPRIAGTEGGTQTREERSPSWCAQQGRRSARRRHVAVGACVPHVVEGERVGDTEIARRFVPRVACAVSPRRQWRESRGVNDPLCHPPNPVPGPVGRGSFTPRLRVSFVRTK